MSCHSELAKNLVISANVREFQTRSFVPQDDNSCEHRCTGEPTKLNESIFSTIPGSPAYVGKALHYRRTSSAFGLPDVPELKGHNAIQGYFQFEG